MLSIAHLSVANPIGIDLGGWPRKSSAEALPLTSSGNGEMDAEVMAVPEKVIIGYRQFQQHVRGTFVGFAEMG